MASSAEPRRAIPFEPVELQPGLVCRLLRADELPAHIAAVAASGLYDDPAQRLARWWRTPIIWPTVIAWRGRILQYDYFQLGPLGSRARDVLNEAGHQATEPGAVGAGLTLRPERDRPRWFWREVRRPVLEQLRAAGYRTMTSEIRADRRDWIEVMKHLWKAEEIGTSPDGRWAHLRYDIATALRQCTGWPERKTAGVAWRWAEEGLQCTEATESDLPAMHAWLATAWGAGHPKVALARRLLDERWNLDRAALLLARDDTGLVGARTIHWRWGRLASQTFLTPLSGQAVDRVFPRATVAWQLAVGYERSSIWVSPSQARHAFVQALLARLPASQRPSASPDGMVDVQWDLRIWARDNNLHTYDDGEWGGAPHALKDSTMD